jgi:hypothetical protein
MNLFFLLWSFGLGVLAGIIICGLFDWHHRRKRWRNEAVAVRRMRAALWP